MKAQNTVDEERFTLLYETYVNEIYQFVFQRVGLDAEKAEDLTQDIFVNVLRTLDSFHGFCSERSWIYKIAHNKVCDYYRSQYRKREQVGYDEDQMEQLEDPNQEIEKFVLTQFTRQTVKACLDDINSDYKVILLMKYMEDMSIKSMAKILNKSPKSVESMLNRARKAFFKEYVIREEKESWEKRKIH